MFSNQFCEIGEVQLKEYSFTTRIIESHDSSINEIFHVRFHNILKFNMCLLSKLLTSFSRSRLGLTAIYS